MLGALLVVGVAGQAQANPNEIPDSGSRPAPAGEVPLPDGSAARIPTLPEAGAGPLAADIAGVEAEIATVVARLGELEPQLDPALDTRQQAEQAWQDAQAERDAAVTALAELVEEAYQGAAAVLPQLNGAPLRDLAAHAPLPVDSPMGGDAAGRELLRADRAEDEAEEAYLAAVDEQESLAGQIQSQESELASLQDELDRLRDRNVALLEEQEEAEQRRAAEESFPLQTTVAGLRAHERAQRAVQFALDQLGKPYLWGAEGPDRYDCSGLMWDAYRSVGETLPRVASDQYRGTRTRPVARQALLPGDLIFFSRSSTDWRQVHHVGMYVGDGRMVHSPNRNDVVKVSPIWWSTFFGATRVVDAVPSGDPAPSPPGSGPPGSGPPTGPTTPSPSPTTPSPSPTGSPTPSPTATPTPSPSGTVVPELSGMTAAEAEEAIRSAGLLPEQGNAVANGCEQPGQVAAQDPQADAEAEQGDTVTYRICEPGLPQVVGETKEDAQTLLEGLQQDLELNFAVAIDYVPAEEGQQPGVVVAMQPAAGTAVREVAEVTLTVTTTETVPEVAEKEEAAAVAALEDLGLEVTIEYVAPQGDAEPGKVRGVEPAAGTPTADVGDEVTLTVVGAELPEVIGETLADALAMLDSGGFADVEVEDEAGEPVDPEENDDRSVVNQEPAPGVHRYGTPVTLIVPV